MLDRDDIHLAILRATDGYVVLPYDTCRQIAIELELIRLEKDN